MRTFASGLYFLPIFVCLLIAFSGNDAFVDRAFADKAELGQELSDAVLFQDLPKIEQLISRGADPSFKSNGRPLLGWAAQNGSLEVVKTLLKAGANPNVADDGIGHTPLMRAIDTHQVEIALELLKAKANPNAKANNGDSCLMMAVQNRKPQIVQALVDAGANVKEVTPYGDSPALRAAEEGSPESLEIIRILGKAKAEMNASNAAYTPLVYAVSQGNAELTKALLEAGADPNIATKGGRFPIHDALDNGEVLKLLLQFKANPNKETEYGDTPLIQAVQNNQLEAVKILVEGGADPNKIGPVGTSALQIAEMYGYQEMLAILKPDSFASKDKTASNSAAGSSTTASNVKCTMADAATRQMELHSKLQAAVNAGKMSSNIFRTFNEDTKDYAAMLTEDPSKACRLFEQLTVKYGV